MNSTGHREQQRQSPQMLRTLRAPFNLPLPSCLPLPARPPCRDEDEAAQALQGFQGRYYAGKPIAVEFSPVTDFREATCRQYEENCCSRGGYCNFMHVRPVSRDLRKQVRAASRAGCSCCRGCLAGWPALRGRVAGWVWVWVWVCS